LAYADLVDLASRPESEAYVRACKADFERRTGTFSVEDPWYEARSRALHDELVTQVAFHRTLPDTHDTSLIAGRTQLMAAFRGLFQLRRPVRGQAMHVVNLIDHAEYYVTVADAFVRRALEAVEEAVFDGRLAASDRQLVLLPGAVLHPEEATRPIAPLVAAGEARGLAPATLLDRLLRMDHQLRVRSRVRASQVYRVDAL
jgi:hypothetical protein